MREQDQSPLRRPSRQRGATALDVPVTIRTFTGQQFKIAGGSVLQQLAVKWSYTVRHRERWTASTEASLQLKQKARRDLQRLGLSEADLATVARSELVEIGTQYVSEAVGWETRIMPWEYFISAATKQDRGQRLLLVIRHLMRPGKVTRRKAPGTTLAVESAPGDLGERYSFDSERRILDRNLQLPETRAHRIQNPTLDELRHQIDGLAPDVIHLAGFDLHQGRRLLEEDEEREPGEEDLRDGYYLAGQDGLPRAVDSRDLGRILGAARNSPLLVSCNIYNSAARTCALAVAEGAAAALGILDEIDDILAEMFFANFFRAWKLSLWDMLAAFSLAWRDLKVHPLRLRGSGVVLWSAESLLERARNAARRRGAGRLDELIAPAHAALIRERNTPIKIGEPGAASIRDVLLVEPTPLDSLNYAVLHNGGNLFDSFRLVKSLPGRLQNIDVEVALQVGPDRFPFRATFDMEQSFLDINPRIRVPLTWQYLPARHESIRTGLYVLVIWEGQTVFCDTYPLTLLPVEEWRDNERDGKWLPSFVLPRDAAVADIVDRAQRYLVALTDDSTAGFDGYQSIDEDADDPYEFVDMQVRALWTVLAYDLNLAYINPPPSYAEASQRLRSPSEVVKGHSGTCIDLALLLAACLEYVDIYPVVFLMNGHAFPGYWRSDEFQDEFIRLAHLFEGDVALDEDDPDSQQVRWMAAQDSYSELVSLIRSDKLVPLETVGLTSRTGFCEAMEEAAVNLNDPSEFYAMLDIRLARDAQVTPLPLRGEIS